MAMADVAVPIARRSAHSASSSSAAAAAAAGSQRNRSSPAAPGNGNGPSGPPYICPTCQTGYSRLEYLRRHERRHQDIRPFVCECGKGFARSDVLSRHKRQCRSHLANGSSSTAGAGDEPIPASKASRSKANARKPVRPRRTKPFSGSSLQSQVRGYARPEVEDVDMPQDDRASDSPGTSSSNSVRWAERSGERIRRSYSASSERERMNIDLPGSWMSASRPGTAATAQAGYASSAMDEDPQRRPSPAQVTAAGLLQSLESMEIPSPSPSSGFERSGTVVDVPTSFASSSGFFGAAPMPATPAANPGLPTVPLPAPYYSSSSSSSSDPGSPGAYFDRTYGNPSSSTTVSTEPTSSSKDGGPTEVDPTSSTNALPNNSSVPSYFAAGSPHFARLSSSAANGAGASPASISEGQQRWPTASQIFGSDLSGPSSVLSGRDLSDGKGLGGLEAEGEQRSGQDVDDEIKAILDGEGVSSATALPPTSTLASEHAQQQQQQQQQQHPFKAYRSQADLDESTTSTYSFNLPSSAPATSSSAAPVGANSFAWTSTGTVAHGQQQAQTFQRPPSPNAEAILLRVMGGSQEMQAGLDQFNGFPGVWGFGPGWTSANLLGASGGAGENAFGSGPSPSMAAAAGLRTGAGSEGLWSSMGHRLGAGSAPAPPPESFGDGPMAQNGAWHLIRQADDAAFRMVGGIEGSVDKARRSVGDPFYIPQHLFRACYAVPHWRLPPIWHLSKLATHTHNNLLKHLPILHEPTFRIDTTPQCLAFAICTVGEASKGRLWWAGVEVSGRGGGGAGGAGGAGGCGGGWRADGSPEQTATIKPLDEDAKQDADEPVRPIVRREKSDMLIKSFAGRCKNIADRSAVVQALLLFNSNSFLSRDEGERTMAAIMHGTVVNMARQAQFFSASADHVRPETANGDHEIESTAIFNCADVYYAASYLPTLLSQVRDEQEKRWRRWIELESRRRTAFLVYVLDTVASLDTNIPTLLSPEELEAIPLPAPDPLWKAPTAKEWGEAKARHHTMTLGEAMTFVFSTDPTKRSDHVSASSDESTASSPNVPLDEFACECGPFARLVVVITLLRGILDLIEARASGVGRTSVVEKWICAARFDETKTDVDAASLLFPSDPICYRYRKALDRWRASWDFDVLCHDASEASLRSGSASCCGSSSSSPAQISASDAKSPEGASGGEGTNGTAAAGGGGARQDGAPPAGASRADGNANANGTDRKRRSKVGPTFTASGAIPIAYDALPFWWTASTMLNVASPQAHAAQRDTPLASALTPPLGGSCLNLSASLDFNNRNLNFNSAGWLAPGVKVPDLRGVLRLAKQFVRAGEGTL